MLSKVAKRVRRRSVQPPAQPASEGETWIEVKGEIVQEAPPLVRWTNILDVAFPRVAMGGYARYYASTSSHKFPSSPPFCPVLSQLPQPPPSTQIPSTSPLFSSSSTTKQRRLAVIPESSTESIGLTHPRALVSISTASPTDNGGGAGPKSSLRRKRRQLLRTPSIERDFAVHSRHLFSSCSIGSDNENENDNEASSLDVPVSHGGGSTHSHSYSTNSTNSHSSQSVGHNSDYLLTPSTSVEGAEDGDVSRVARRLEEEEKMKKEGDEGLEIWMKMLKFSEPPSRRASGASFSTARSEFGDSPVVPSLPEDASVRERV